MKLEKWSLFDIICVREDFVPVTLMLTRNSRELIVTSFPRKYFLIDCTDKLAMPNIQDAPWKYNRMFFLFCESLISKHSMMSRHCHVVCPVDL